MPENRTLIFIPTYNKAENVERIFCETRSLDIDADILFLDDNSPYGTGQIIDTIAKNNNNVFVIHRTGKLGIGSAHRQGIAWVYDRQYAVLITMDCDFTHLPSYIFNFIQQQAHADVVVGSRYIKKHSLASWNLFRKSLTHLGHFLTATLLNMPFKSPKQVLQIFESASFFCAGILFWNKRYMYTGGYSLLKADLSGDP